MLAGCGHAPRESEAEQHEAPAAFKSPRRPLATLAISDDRARQKGEISGADDLTHTAWHSKNTHKHMLADTHTLSHTHRHIKSKAALFKID